MAEALRFHNRIGVFRRKTGYKNEIMRGWILEALETDQLPTPAYTDDRASRFSFCYDENDFIQIYAGTPETKDAWELWPEVAPEYMD